MTDFPRPAIPPLFLHTWSRYSGIYGDCQTAFVGVSLTYPLANMAVYVPMGIPWPYPVKRVFWVNGSSITSTNMDFGIYAQDGTKIYSTGSTAASGTSTTQYVTPATDILLGPGIFYFALSDSSTTANRGGWGIIPGIDEMRISGVLQEASALPLPANMTGVAVANPVAPIFGVTQTPSGF